MIRKLPILAPALFALALAMPPNTVAAEIGAQRVVGATANASAESPEGLIAPAAACPGQDRLDAPAQVQVQAMRCMTDFARERAGLAALGAEERLDSSARDKAGDVLRCDEFSHFACGRAFTYWMEESGYLLASCWRAGENLAWGTGEEGTVRSIFRAWMRSPGHRKNILGDYAQLGIGLRVGNLEGLGGTRVWAQHFGSRCEESSPQP